MNKKLLAIGLAVPSMFVAGQAFAVATIDASTTIGSLVFAPSNNVYLKAASGAAGYVAEALHQSGSRVFATDSVESVIYWRDASIASTQPTSSFGTGTWAAPSTATTHGTPDVTSGYVAM